PAPKHPLRHARTVRAAGQPPPSSSPRPKQPTLPQDAAQRALHVLEHVPATRLRSTARTRLHQLATALPTGHAADLTERLRTLPTAIDHHGHAL
ncbi:hypothetical protein ACFCX5_34160, partial [Streptomyces sp. NPDC056304]